MSFKELSYVIRSRFRFSVGYFIIFLTVAICICAPLLATHDPEASNPLAVLMPPSGEYYLGTDSTGMDIFSRVLFAPRVDLLIAVFGTALSAIVGTSAGMWVGYYAASSNWRGSASFFIMRVADVFQSFPVFVFSIALVAALGQSIQTVVFAIAFVNAPIYLRLMRGQAMNSRRMRYNEAAEIAGLSPWQIMIRHILPNSAGPVLAQMSINTGWSILLAAGLSFIGAGVRPPTPELGSMIASGFQAVATGQWWPSVVPGVVLAIIVLGFALIGESFEVVADTGKMRALMAEMTDKKARKRLAAGKG